MTTQRHLSNEEIYFEWFLDELIELGYVKEYSYEAVTLSVTADSFEIREIDPLKRKTKLVIKDKILIPGTVYTPDYHIIWNEKAKDIFYLDVQDYEYYKQSLQYVPFFAEDRESFVEIKPTWDQNNMTRAFMLKRAALASRGVDPVYINLIKIPKFFETYCMPKRYELTDKTAKPRNIKFEYTLITEYIPFMQALNKELNKAYKKKA